jgi:hypothetical protein
VKERNRHGQFRATETHNYKKKMKDHFGTFTSEAEEAFNEAALDKYDFASKGCPKGFRSTGYQTIAGQRREVCCSSDGKTCMTADGIPL